MTKDVVHCKEQVESPGPDAGLDGMGIDLEAREVPTRPIPHDHRRRSGKEWARGASRVSAGRDLSQAQATRRELGSLFDSAITADWYRKEIAPLERRMKIARERIREALIDYDLDVLAYGNEIYSDLAIRFVMYMHCMRPNSWHQDRQALILDSVRRAAWRRAIDIGFGVPMKHVRWIISRDGKTICLADKYDSALTFAENALSSWSGNANWHQKITLRKLDMDSQVPSESYDLYILSDSLEHSRDPGGFASAIRDSAAPGAQFIFLLPIGPCMPQHHISWGNETELLSWLSKLGFVIERHREVRPRLDGDVFARPLKGHLADVAVACRLS